MRYRMQQAIQTDQRTQDTSDVDATAALRILQNAPERFQEQAYPVRPGRNVLL
jgi:hypothetical protein